MAHMKPTHETTHTPTKLKTARRCQEFLPGVTIDAKLMTTMAEPMMAAGMMAHWKA